MGQLADRGSLQGQPSGARGELAGKCAPSEGRQYLPCAEPRQAGWANGALKRGASSVEQAGQRFGTRRRLGRRGPEAKSSTTCTAFLVLFWCGVKCGPAESVVLCAWNRAVRAPLTLRCAWPVPLWYRGRSRESCGLRSAEVRSVVRWKCAVRVSSDRGDRDETYLLTDART
jgi:hypothetical protein